MIRHVNFYSMPVSSAQSLCISLSIEMIHFFGSGNFDENIHIFIIYYEYG